MSLGKTTKPERRYAKQVAPYMAQALGVGLTARLLRYGRVIDHAECKHEIIEFPMEITEQEITQ